MNGIVRRALLSLRQFVGMGETIKENVPPLAAIEIAGKPSELQLGEYEYANRCRRALLAVVDGYCVYSMDGIDAPVIHLTLCSTKTWMTSAGMHLVRPFTAQEVSDIGRKAVSLRSFSWAGMRERALFFGKGRLPGLRDLPHQTKPEPKAEPLSVTSDLAPAVAQPEPPQAIPLSPSWMRRVISYLRNVLSILFHRRHPASAPSISSANA